jgi:hypothetical protein
MRTIKVTKEFYTDPQCAGQNSVTRAWEPLRPELYDCNFVEWFKHDILGRHFTFGQPYCVACGKCELTSPTTNE